MKYEVTLKSGDVYIVSDMTDKELRSMTIIISNGYCCSKVECDNCPFYDGSWDKACICGALVLEKTVMIKEIK